MMIHIRYWWYDLKYGIKNLYTFFNVIWNFRPWSAYSTYATLKLHLTLLRKNIEIYYSAAPQIAEIDLALEILNHKIKDDYYERCGWVPTKSTLEKTELGYKLGELSEEEITLLTTIFENAMELEHYENELLFNTLKNIDHWSS